MTAIGWRDLQDKARGRTRPRPAPNRISPETHHTAASIAHEQAAQEGFSMQAIWLFVAGSSWGLAIGIIIAGLLR